jgi:hypothetical protein
MVGNAGFSSGYVTSRGGQAFSFDGSSGSMARVDDTPDLNPSGPPGFTVDAWAKLHDFFQPNNGAVVGKGAAYAEAYVIDHNGSVWRGFIRQADNNQAAVIAAPASIDVWTHLALTWDGFTVRFYVNGAEAGSLVATSIRVADTWLGIGRRDESLGPPASDFEFNGLVDEVGYWGRALTGAEVRAIYNAGKAGKC